MSQASLVILGARGSIPVSGPEFARHGGNSTCFAVVVNGLTVAFVDAGTGLAAYRQRGLHLAPQIGLFITHYHWDHVQGLSMFDEIWQGGCDISLFGPGDAAETLTAAISPPLFPVSIADAQTIRCDSMDGAMEFGGVSFTGFPVHHPQGGLGYRLDGPQGSIGIVTDHETGTDIDAAVLEAVRGVDVLIHDAQYRPDEMNRRHGWGHSTFVDAVNLANAAEVGRLILTSHDPGRTDDDLDEVVAEARRSFPNVDAASEGMEVPL